MGTRFSLNLLVALMTLSSVALAEGNCPAGFYPIGGAGCPRLRADPRPCSAAGAEPASRNPWRVGRSLGGHRG